MLPEGWNCSCTLEMKTISKQNELKYGFCKKLFRYKWTSDQLNIFYMHSLNGFAVQIHTLEFQVKLRELSWKELNPCLQDGSLGCYPLCALY